MKTFNSLIPITREWLNHPDTQLQFYILFGVGIAFFTIYFFLIKLNDTVSGKDKKGMEKRFEELEKYGIKVSFSKLAYITPFLVERICEEIEKRIKEIKAIKIANGGWWNFSIIVGAERYDYNIDISIVDGLYKVFLSYGFRL